MSSGANRKENPTSLDVRCELTSRTDPKAFTHVSQLYSAQATYNRPWDMRCVEDTDDGETGSNRRSWCASVRACSLYGCPTSSNPQRL